MVQNNSEIAQLKKQIEAQQAIIESLKAELNWKDEQIALFKKTLFGKKTERTIISDQLELNLFNEAETYSTPLKTEPSLNYDTQKVREHERKKKRSRNIDDLEVTKVLLDLAEEDKFDPITGESLRFIGSNFRKELVHHKEYYEVIEYEQKVYAKKDEEGNEELVKKAMPTAVIPGSFATPSLLASIIDKKFTQSLPLYRQEQSLERNGITLSRQTMANWMIKLHDLYFDVFVEHMHKQLLKSEYLNVDETTLEVLELLKTEGRQNCYMWLYKTGRSEDKQMAIYRFENDRKHERVKNYLNGYTNVVQSDGYAAYQNLESVTNMGCFAHLRRGFVEAIEAAPKGTDVKNSVTQRLVNLLD
ncbi:IS66 family transposase, partial [Faecalibacillus intestinalis]